MKKLFQHFLPGLLVLVLSGTASAQFSVVEVPTSRSLYDVTYSDAVHAFAVGDSGTILYSADGGTSWEDQSLSTSTPFTEVSFFNATTGLILDGGLLRTTDSGNSWQRVVLSWFPTEVFTDLFILDGQKAFLSGDGGTLMMSNDMGASWQTVLSDTLRRGPWLLHFLNKDLGYSIRGGGGTLNQLFKTQDGGANWSIIDFQSGGDQHTVLEDIHFVSESVGFVGGWYNPILKKTTDGGLNWQNVYSEGLFGAPQLYGFHFISANNAYAFGWYGYIYKSINGGENWYLATTNDTLGRSIRAMDFADSQRGVAVGESGLLLKTENGGGILQTGVVETAETKRIFIYPNPTHDELRIKNSSSVTITNIDVIDQTGRIVLKAVPSAERVDVSGLTPGTYILKAYTREAGIVTESFIKQ